jgi:hypothetical protein
MIANRPAVMLAGGSPRRFAAGLGLLVALAALMATLGAANASAYECYSGMVNPGECNLQPLKSIGHDVVPTTTTYFVYWDPKGAPRFPAGYASGIKTFFKGLEHDNGTDQNFYSVLTQYRATYETHVGKAITDKHPYPAEPSDCDFRPSSPCVSFVQIGEELSGLVRENKLPGQHFEPGQSYSAEPTHSYFVLLPPGVSICDGDRSGHVAIGCSSRNFCSYHDHAFIKGDPESAENLVWAGMPYLPGITGCETPQHPNGPVDSELNVMEHEFAEMITDPLSDGWANSPTTGEEEVADICESGRFSAPSKEFEEKMDWGTPLGTASNGALYNQVIDGRDYYLQQMYSDEVQGCRQRTGLPPTVTKLAPAKGSVAGGKKVKITGLNFENPTVTGVSFGSVPAKEFTVTSPTSITAVSPASGSTGVVKVTLTTSAGTNASTTTDQFTYE